MQGSVSKSESFLNSSRLTEIFWPVILKTPPVGEMSPPKFSRALTLIFCGKNRQKPCKFTYTRFILTLHIPIETPGGTKLVIPSHEQCKYENTLIAKISISYGKESTTATICVLQPIQFISIWVFSFHFSLCNMSFFPRLLGPKNPCLYRPHAVHLCFLIVSL